MLYFLVSNVPPKTGQESDQAFSKINLIATTPKGFAFLVLGVLALSLLTFMIGFDSGKDFGKRELTSAISQTPPSVINTPLEYVLVSPDAKAPRPGSKDVVEIPGALREIVPPPGPVINPAQEDTPTPLPDAPPGTSPPAPSPPSN